MIETPRRLSPPIAIDIEREYVIEQVVSWRNRSKHLADSTPRRLRIARSVWSGADDDGLIRCRD